MPDHVHLIGAESVEAAGRNMASAAEDFGRHVSYLGEHLDGFLRRFEELVERMEAARPPDVELTIDPPKESPGA